MENNKNLVNNLAIAVNYAKTKADSICGEEKMHSEVWNYQYSKYYDEKLEELTKNNSSKKTYFFQYKYSYCDESGDSIINREDSQILDFETTNQQEILVQAKKKLATICHYSTVVILNYYPVENKLNSVELKYFSPDSFKAYIDQLSDKDKVECVRLLIESLGQDGNYHVRYDESTKIKINNY